MAAWEVVLYKYTEPVVGSGILIRQPVEKPKRETIYFHADPTKSLEEVFAETKQRMAAEGLTFRSITLRRTLANPAEQPAVDTSETIN